jgi:excisionase family DNA binding protein
MEALLTAPEAAELLRINRWDVYELAKTHVIPSVRIGRRVRFRPSDLEACIDEHTVGATSERADRNRGAA